MKVPAYSDPDAQMEWIKAPKHEDGSIPSLLTIDSSPATILERVRNSPRLWGSLWADYQMVYYGPQRYRPPARAYRFQVWVSQPDRSQVAIPTPGGIPIGIEGGGQA